MKKLEFMCDADKIFNSIELKPVDGRKSFYNKCVLLERHGIYYLYSYTTLVCKWDKNKREFEKIWNGWSQTTQRHVNALMEYLGIDKHGKNWWVSLKCCQPYVY